MRISLIVFLYSFKGGLFDFFSILFHIKVIETRGSRSMSTVPSVIIFPQRSGASVKREIILRNACSKDLIVKISVSDPRAIRLEGTFILIQARKYTTVPIVFDQKYSTSNQLIKIFARPIESHNHKCLREWVQGSSKSETTRILAAKLTAKVANSFSSKETIIDLPASACLIEPVVKAVVGMEDSDTVTAYPIDGDTFTAANIRPSEQLKISPSATEAQERCWLLGPLIDTLFPPAAMTNSAVNHEQHYTPCAGAA